MKLQQAPCYSRIRVQSFGSVQWLGGDFVGAVDDVSVLWTECVALEDPFATVEIRGVLDAAEGVVWLPDDAEVEVVDPPRYAGMPADLAALATPVQAPQGSQGLMKTADGWPELIWCSDSLFSAVSGWTDPQLSVEILLCALHVAPDAGDLRPMLLGALAARYANMTKDPRTYPPERYPWRNGPTVGNAMLEYLAG